MHRQSAGVLIWVAWLSAAIAADQPASGLVSREAHLMGTVARLSAYAPDRADGLSRLEQALRALESTEAELSTWRDDTPLAALNRRPIGERTTLEEGQCGLFSSLETWVRASGRSFDPAIGALISAWGVRSGGRIPSPEDLARARAASGWDLLAFDRASCVVNRRAAVVVDEGGFGKGEALDRARGALEDWPHPWVIDLGGQVAVSGVPPGSPGWRVDVAHPEDRGRRLLSLDVRGGSVAVSGGSERDGRVGDTRVSHILDPRTGRPAAFLGSVVVWHERALSADILSTALFVMGPDAGLRWADAHALAVCYLEAGRHDPPRVRASRAFAERFGLTLVPPSAPAFRRPSAARSR